jgi:hypothetical protein
VSERGKCCVSYARNRNDWSTRVIGQQIDPRLIESERELSSSFAIGKRFSIGKKKKRKEGKEKEKDEKSLRATSTTNVDDETTNIWSFRDQRRYIDARYISDTNLERDSNVERETSRLGSLIRFRITPPSSAELSDKFREKWPLSST